MTLRSFAQELFVIDPISPSSQLPAYDEHSLALPIEIPLEVSDPVDMDIVVEELPGAPPGTKDPEIEVADESLHVEDQDTKEDKKTSGKNEKWDWSKHGPHGFTNWIKERLDSVPKHSGYDSAGLERAMSYMEKLDTEISKAMRLDLDGELDADKIEKIRAELDEGLARLQVRLEKVKDSKKSTKKKKKSSLDFDLVSLAQQHTESDVNAWVNQNSVPGETWSLDKVLIQIANNGEEPGFEESEMIKEAQKVLGVKGVYIMVPSWIASLARICVNGTVSAGHDINDLYNRLIKKYGLNEREKLELIHCLFDMGYPLRMDRGFLPDEEVDITSSNNFDWAANYKG